MKASLYWGLLLIVFGMAFGIIQSILVTVFIAVIAAIIWSRRRQKRIKCRQLYPKDYAYCLYIESMSQPMMARIESILAELPQKNESEVEAWIKEFEEVDSYTERVAAAGSIWILGREKVRELFTTQFPFLAMLGLYYAVCRSAYYARHNGHNKHPTLKPGEI
ncbi:MAG TPA: hypothetical protein VGH19_21530 [Verrucomicrobiae bacterium]